MLNLLSDFDIHNVIGHNITFVNPYSWQLVKDLDQDITDSFLVFSDGILLVKLFNVTSKNGKILRFSFDDTSIAPVVFNYLKDVNLSLFLVGGLPGVTEKARDFIIAKYPGINIHGVSSGYFHSEVERNKVLKKAMQCDFVLVGMGTPYQEEFLHDLRLLGWKGTGFTCGGYLDQLVESDGELYYPAIIDKMQLRAFYRLYKEPIRLWKRYLVFYPKFISTFMQERIKSGKL